MLEGQYKQLLSKTIPYASDTNSFFLNQLFTPEELTV